MSADPPAAAAAEPLIEARLISLGFVAIGAPGMIWLCLTFLAFSGAADMVSSAYRHTVLQSAVPDEFRGRLQGLLTVVVAGGPRLGDFVAGSIGALLGEAAAIGWGGVACVLSVVVAVCAQHSFLRYDARDGDGQYSVDSA